MADIGAELLEAVRKRFTRSLSSDRMATELLERIRSGKTSFADAENYAYRVGKLLAEALGGEISADVLPDGVMTREIAEAILGPMLRQDYELVTDAAAETMEALNSAAGLHMRSARPPISQDRVEGLIEKASSYDSYEKAAWVFQEPVENFSQHVCDRVIEENVNAHFKAGLSPKITRTAVGGCCKWCSSLDGKYDYPAPREVYRRHENCRCLVLYDPGDGKVQNAHTKKQYDSIIDAEQEAKAEARKKKLEKWAKDEAMYPEGRREILRRVKTGEYSLKLKHQKYLQHTQGTAQYNLAMKERNRLQSYLTISEKEAQEIINRYTGLGDPQIDDAGRVGNSEFFSTGRLIGYYHEDGVPLMTDRVQIVHGKRGSHIIPVAPLEVRL